MRAEVIADGLWRWTAPHPEWAQAPAGSSGDWPREVGCVLYRSGEHAVFIDPLVGGDEDAFWEWADARCAGRAVATLETSPFHRRSRERIIERYGASTAAPAGVEPLPFPALTETMFWIGEHRALVPGDLLLASDPGGELAVCPESWFAQAPPGPVGVRAMAAAALAPLRALDAAIVLVSHGEPVLAGGAAAIARALDRALATG